MSKYEIIAVGASAGGLKAISTILLGISPDIQVSILIVQHLSPELKSYMVNILQRCCKMKMFKEAENNETIQPSVVYIAPPDKHMLIRDRKIVLTSTEPMHFVRPSIDLLFESVAANFNGRAIGVILTGMNTDGAMGIKAIKEKGGVTIAQDEKTSEFFVMPKAAIETGAVDYILPIQDIAPTIIALVKQ